MSLTHGSALRLPRMVMDGKVKIIEPGRAKFDDIEVILLPDGKSLILGALGYFSQERGQITGQDAWAGLIDFLEAASRYDGQNYATVSVGFDTLAHLYAQRVLKQADLVEGDGLEDVGNGVWELQLSPRAGYADELTIRVSPDWKTIQAGRRDATESDSQD